MRRNLFRKGKPGPNVPPLGWRDICLYLLALVLSGGGAVLGFGTMLWWRKELTAFLAPEALCTAQTSGIWLFVLGGLTMMGLFGCALDYFAWKYPILGAPGVSYGGEEWDPVYPMLLKDPDAPEAVKKAVNTARTNLVLWGVAWVAAALVLVLWAGGGTRLYPDGSIRTTVGFGEVTAAYAPEQIERIFLEVEKPSSRNRSPGEWWELKLTFRTQDNELIEFCVHDFAADPSGGSEIDRLRELLERYPADILRFENGEDLGRLYGRYEYDQEDQQYLEELFGVR